LNYLSFQLLEIPISVSHRRDTVPAYVADYLNSAPRDPLAAEESSRSFCQN